MTPSKKKHNNNSFSVELEKRQKHFQGAISFLKKTKISVDHTSKKLLDLPWYLVIGEPNTDKTQLLTNAGLKFVLTKRNSKVFKTEQRHCDWWATREAVFLNANSQYFYQKDNYQKAFWEDLLGLVAKSHKPCLQGVIIVLDLAHLAVEGKDRQQKLFNTLKLRLQEIEKVLDSSTPIYFIFNHTDCLTGFTEYFDGFTIQELKQAWGVSFHQGQIASPQRAADSFDVEYDNLLKDLNQLVIPKLHQQRSVDKRSKIKDFPVQMESLKRSLAIFLQHIAKYTTGGRHSKLRGMYFTSLNLGKEHVDRLLKPLSQSFELALPNASNKKTRAKTYFIEGLFKDIIFPDAKLFVSMQTQKSSKRRQWVQRIALGTAAAALLVAVVNWSAHFTMRIKEFNEAENVLAQYKILATTQSLSSISQQVTALNLLSNARDVLTQDPFPWFIQYDKAHRRSLAKTADVTYDTVLTDLITNELSQILQGLITSPGHAAEVYGALKSYSMLEDPEHYNPDYIRHWLTEYINSLPSATQEQRQGLMKHIDNFVKIYHGGANLDQKLILQAQQYLQKNPPELLALAILNNDLLGNKNFTLYQYNPHGYNIIKTQSDINIPAIYTEQYFRKVYDTLIPIAVNTITQGNWVTGNDSTQLSPQILIKKTREAYLSQYLKLWLVIATQLRVNQPQDLTQAALALNNFSQQNSALKQLLNNIYQNTHITYENLPTPISLPFTKLNRFIADNYFGQQSPLLNSLSQLDSKVLAAANQQNPNQAAFQLTKTYLSGTDNTLQQLKFQLSVAPQPYKAWLQSIILSTEQLLLNDSASYINQQWQQQIVKNYQQKLAPYYPINMSSQSPLAVADFNEFFNPKGKLSGFLKQYVQAFTVTKHKQVQWRKLKGLSMPFSDELLGLYHRSDLIASSMFNPMTAQYGMELAIAPVTLANNIKEIDIAINNKGAQYTQTGEKPTVFYWPNTKASGSIMITLVGSDGKQSTLSEQGPWAIYRLLDKSQHQKHEKDHTIKFDIQSQGKQAKLMLVSHSKVNPFGSQLIQGFTLPQTIIKK